MIDGSKKGPKETFNVASFSAHTTTDAPCPVLRSWQEQLRPWVSRGHRGRSKSCCVTDHGNSQGCPLPWASTHLSLPSVPRDLSTISFYLRVSDPRPEDLLGGVVGHRAVQWFCRVQAVGPGVPSPLSASKAQSQPFPTTVTRVCRRLANELRGL